MYAFNFSGNVDKGSINQQNTIILVKKEQMNLIEYIVNNIVQNVFLSFYERFISTFFRALVKNDAAGPRCIQVAENSASI